MPSGKKSSSPLLNAKLETVKNDDYSSLFLESNALKQQSVQINVSLGHYFPLKNSLSRAKLEVTSIVFENHSKRSHI